jgi:deazaflavin-dependent oxidoreductase (nitroreductase family)
MRFDKRRTSTALAKYLFNPLVKAEVTTGLLRDWAVLKTAGRRSGQRRRTPVGNGLEGDTFWIVAEHCRRAGYVRHIEADPRVRVNIGGQWRTGTARPLPDDDPRERLRRIGRRLNAAAVRAMGSELLTVRIDLNPDEPHGPGDRT